MTVKLSDAAYSRLMWSLREIACGHKQREGYPKPHRLLMIEMQTIARTVCEEFGWNYSINKINESLKE